MLEKDTNRFNPDDKSELEGVAVAENFSDGLQATELLREGDDFFGGETQLLENESFYGVGSQGTELFSGNDAYYSGETELLNENLVDNTVGEETQLLEENNAFYGEETQLLENEPIEGVGSEETQLLEENNSFYGEETQLLENAPIEGVGSEETQLLEENNAFYGEETELLAQTNDNGSFSENTIDEEVVKAENSDRIDENFNREHKTKNKKKFGKIIAIGLAVVVAIFLLVCFIPIEHCWRCGENKYLFDEECSYCWQFDDFSFDGYSYTNDEPIQMYEYESEGYYVVLYEYSDQTGSDSDYTVCTHEEVYQYYGYVIDDFEIHGDDITGTYQIDDNTILEISYYQYRWLY